MGIAVGSRIDQSTIFTRIVTPFLPRDQAVTDFRYLFFHLNHSYAEAQNDATV
jgi:hypothetical protein